MMRAGARGTGPLSGGQSRPSRVLLAEACACRASPAGRVRAHTVPATTTGQHHCSHHHHHHHTCARHHHHICSHHHLSFSRRSRPAPPARSRSHRSALPPWPILRARPTRPPRLRLHRTAQDPHPVVPWLRQRQRQRQRRLLCLGLSSSSLPSKLPRARTRTLALALPHMLLTRALQGRDDHPLPLPAWTKAI